jgi:hypothetical protein
LSALSSCDIEVHGIIVIKSVSLVFHHHWIYHLSKEFALSQITQFDHHSTSVFAININHHAGVQFLGKTIYLYCQSAVADVHNPVSAAFNGSSGIPFNPAASNCGFISFISIQ